MPSRRLVSAIAVPAVLTFASAFPTLAASESATAAKPQDAPTPNLIFVMADDLGWADLSSDLANGGHGNDFNETPVIDGLAADGQVFTEAYASVQCSPTRTALHTGQYAVRSTNNVYAVGAITGNASAPLRGVTQGRLAEDGRTAIPVGYQALGETLQDAGYTTGYTGKFHVTGSIDEITQAHGFDENWGGSSNSHATYYFATNNQFNDSVAPSLDQFGADYTQAYVDANIAPYSQGVSEAQLDALVGTDKHVTDAQTDATLDFIDRSKDEPFFAFVSEFAPHFPVNDAQARPDLLAKYKAKAPGADPAKPSYAALTEGVDQSVARIVDYLETTPDPRNDGRPLSENTVLIFTSDNGGEEDPINSGAWNGPLRADKGQLYEGGIRVPWIVWSANPDLVRGGGRVNDSLVNSTDLYPTLASYAGATLPAGVPFDGVDLRPAFSKGTHVERTHFHHLPGYVGVQGPGSIIRDGRWKLYYKYADQTFELYDLRTDVGETENLAAAKPGLVRSLGGKLIAWLDETDAPLATVRAGRPALVLEDVSGLTYANDEVTRRDGETLTIAPGEEVPFVLPAN
ncbi:sulfatase-like hydrolase/transferase [Nocardioides stalactiti]|uniref:sulfatase-like hydrolase/transferase n=1 Tax=Nocardioides stalactiti TaxID=2755356 RepID=UPI00160441EF|nr:sulfatase-like hydrolase/transferase [Nocardioides stalactiti]